jgi:tripartite-type tricarboxylate transporter receptor subunit TctC
MVKSWWMTIVAVTMTAGLAHAADTYPSKPIRLIVPWPPGGGVDTSARMLAQPLSERIGQPIVVENKPGAAGNIGTELFTREKPDGYTLLMGSISPNAINTHLYARLGFDPVKDFAPIARFSTVPNFLVVPASSPAKTVQELIALAKASPGKLNYGSGGPGSSQHLSGVMFKTATGIDVVHVAYKGTAPAETAVVAGQVDFLVDTPTCLPYVRAGRLRALAVAAKTRNPAMPDVPTLDELGIPGIYTATWYGPMAPAKTPKAIVDRLNAEVNAVLKTPEMRKRLLEFAAEPGGGTPEEFAQFIVSEIARYADIVKVSGAKMEQ